MTRLLVVEDERLVRELLRDHLMLAGYEVEVASNGREGLALLDAWQPQLILLDLHMPEMNGWQFRRFQQKFEAHADIPVVLITAAANPDIQKEVLSAAGLITKPFDPDEVIDMVERLTSDDALVDL